LLQELELKSNEIRLGILSENPNLSDSLAKAMNEFNTIKLGSKVVPFEAFAVRDGSEIQDTIDCLYVFDDISVPEFDGVVFTNCVKHLKLGALFALTAKDALPMVYLNQAKMKELQLILPDDLLELMQLK
jgi:signal recognition particle GTPase